MKKKTNRKGYSEKIKLNVISRLTSVTPSCGLVTMAWATVWLKKDNDYDGDDDDSGPCPIFPIRLRRLPDHRADGTTGLMIEHPFVKDHDDDDDYIYDIDDVDYDDDCKESMINIIIKVPNMQWQAWWIIRPPVGHNCRSQSAAETSPAALLKM